MNDFVNLCFIYFLIDFKKYIIWWVGFETLKVFCASVMLVGCVLLLLIVSVLVKKIAKKDCAM